VSQAFHAASCEAKRLVRKGYDQAIRHRTAAKHLHMKKAESTLLRHGHGVLHFQRNIHDHLSEVDTFQHIGMNTMRSPCGIEESWHFILSSNGNYKQEPLLLERFFYSRNDTLLLVRNMCAYAFTRT
jgi:hypothetical protein